VIEADRVAAPRFSWEGPVGSELFVTVRVNRRPRDGAHQALEATGSSGTAVGATRPDSVSARPRKVVTCFDHR